MAKLSTTHFSQPAALMLEIDPGTPQELSFPVSHFVASFALNEIPVASAVLAVGRSMPSGQYTPLHNNLHRFRSTVPVNVWIMPQGYSSGNQAWPTGQRLLFRGFISGVGSKRLNGRSTFVVHLSHRLVQLTFSSALTPLGHTANPAAFNAAAVFQAMTAQGALTPNQGAGAKQGVGITTHLSSAAITSIVPTDVWGAIKTLLVLVASTASRPLLLDDCPGANGVAASNAAALDALQWIEGPGNFVADQPYRWSRPLPLHVGNLTMLADAVRDTITGDFALSYAGTTFWDKLVGHFAPLFGLAVVPRPEVDLVIADLPAYKDDVWRHIPAEHIDSLDVSGQLERPILAVGTQGAVAAGAYGGVDINLINQAMSIRGCYVNPAPDAAQGTILVAPAPVWLQKLRLSASPNPDPNRLNTAQGGPALGAQTAAPGPAPTDVSQVRQLYSRYAEALFHRHALRGRQGTLSGPLRFDIAPGSLVSFAPPPDRFHVASTTDQGAIMIGCVTRVSVAIDANTPAAATTFQLSHLRTAGEQLSGWVGTSVHPLFEGNIAVTPGSPLIDDYLVFDS